MYCFEVILVNAFWSSHQICNWMTVKRGPFWWLSYFPVTRTVTVGEWHWLWQIFGEILEPRKRLKWHNGKQRPPKIFCALSAPMSVRSLEQVPEGSRFHFGMGAQNYSAPLKKCCMTSVGPFGHGDSAGVSWLLGIQTVWCGRCCKKAMRPPRNPFIPAIVGCSVHKRELPFCLKCDATPTRDGFPCWYIIQCRPLKSLPYRALGCFSSKSGPKRWRRLWTS